MKVTVESASTSETEDIEDLDDVIHHPDLAESLDVINVTKYQQLQVRILLCALSSIKANRINHILCRKLCLNK